MSITKNRTLEIVNFKKETKIKVDKLSAKEISDKWNELHILGDKNPFKWTEQKVSENLSYHKYYLTSLLIEKFLTHKEYLELF
jgi:hypothetical protein